MQRRMLELSLLAERVDSLYSSFFPRRGKISRSCRVPKKVKNAAGQSSPPDSDPLQRPFLPRKKSLGQDKFVIQTNLLHSVFLIDAMQYHGLTSSFDSGRFLSPACSGR